MYAIPNENMIFLPCSFVLCVTFTHRFASISYFPFSHTFHTDFISNWIWQNVEMAEGVCKTGDVQYTLYLRCVSIYCTGLTSEPWNGNVNILPCANVHVVCAVPHYSNTRQCIYIYVLNHVHNAMHSAHTHTHTPTPKVSPDDSRALSLSHSLHTLFRFQPVAMLVELMWVNVRLQLIYKFWVNTTWKW